MSGALNVPRVGIHVTIKMGSLRKSTRVQTTINFDRTATSWIDDGTTVTTEHIGERQFGEVQRVPVQQVDQEAQP